MRQMGQCDSCVHWGRRGGTVLPAVEGCSWIADPGLDQLPTVLKLLLPALARIAAREGVCPGHLVFDASSMPDAFRSHDIEPARCNRTGLDVSGTGAILRTSTETGEPSHDDLEGMEHGTQDSTCHGSERQRCR